MYICVINCCLFGIWINIDDDDDDDDDDDVKLS